MASSDEFCGIDPDGMGRLASSLGGAADRLTSLSRELDGRLRRYGISAPELREIADIAGWGGEQVSMLRRRIDLINDLGAGAPEPGGTGGAGGSSLVRLPADLEALEAARGLATMYGKDIFVNFEGDFQAKLIHEHADEVAALAKNPQAAAAFYALLSPKVRDTLPGLIAATGSKTAKQDLAAFGEALGAALRAPALVPAFARVKADLTKPAGSRAAAWQRLALLKSAGAPTAVRSAAARSLVLDDFARKPRQDWRAGEPTETKAYGLPSDLVALGLEVLAGDGAAVRAAFAGMGGTEVKLTQAEKMKRFLDYAKGAGTGDEVADAFGRAMEAGTETKTEKPGQHSPEAGAFALDVIRAAGSFENKLPDVMKDSMGVLAKSYVHELVSGGRFDKAADRDSGMKTPGHWKALPGVNPAFYLSPDDTARFMKTFIGEESISSGFDSEVAKFRYGTLMNAARLDSRSENNYFRDVSMMFGDFGSVAFRAKIDVLGEEDAVADLTRDFTKNTAGFLLGEIPVVSQVAELGWDLAQAYIISSLSDKWADSFETQVEAATENQAELSKRLKYDMAHLLQSGGYPASDPPEELISKSTGALKTYDELVAEAKREASGDKKWEQALQEKLSVYESWMDGNGKFDDKVENSSRAQTSDLAGNLLKDQSRN